MVAKVTFVDYGNETQVSLNDLRKDLVVFDIPILSFPVKLHGIKLTKDFDCVSIHNTFEGNNH